MTEGDDSPEEGEQAPSAVDPKGNREAKRRMRKAEREALAFWQSVFADPVGRREMWGILQACHAFEERFGCGPNGAPQPEATWLYAGEQKIGWQLYRSWMRLAPEGVFAMLQEHDPGIRKQR